ncbi:hypothetical protein H4R34_003052 [Dimargaris verticillata]|uniref:Pyridoxamine 5'-phosphate oxidase Alr4036 family FMN-binding domain-containing protein n=1 Tax=Dimargaris verticillata TaxID=2761393 RepID=A0A9W8B6U2_9FUNG|nr:hypothetical protein H4R34_003052 [Dimargaris verticillata]
MPTTTTFPPWRSLLQASLKQGFDHGPNAVFGVFYNGTIDTNACPIELAYAQLATIGTDGFPRNRTIVVRGFLGEHEPHPQLTNFLAGQVITDASEKQQQLEAIQRLGQGSSELLVSSTHLKSNKMRELQRDSHCEVCWYFDSTHEQYRLRGQMFTITSPTYYGHDMQAQQQQQATLRYLEAYRYRSNAPDPSHIVASNDTRQLMDWEVMRVNQFFHLKPELRSGFSYDYTGQPWQVIAQSEYPVARSQLQLTRLCVNPEETVKGSLSQPEPAIPISTSSDGNSCTARANATTGSVDLPASKSCFMSNPALLGQVQHALENFVLLVFKVDTVDHVQLNTRPATRTFYMQPHQIPKAWQTRVLG